MQRSHSVWRAGLGALAMVMALLVGGRGNPPGAIAQSVQSQNLSVTTGAGSVVTVDWRGTPGNSQDWVSVVHAGVADDVYEATWTYTGGQRSGTYGVGRLSPGSYEARLYLDWPNGGYRVVDRLRFTVGSAVPAFQGRTLGVNVGSAGEVVVSWHDTPGNVQDWVSVVHAGVSDDTYESTWVYTGGQTAGTYNAGRLGPGDYELRLYLDWPNGGYQVVDRVRFRVG